jgi:branched-chain amino acid transport system permease protein
VAARLPAWPAAAWRARLPRGQGPVALGLLALAVVAPLVVPNDYWIGVMARICLYATLALGLNVVVGFAGLLDLGYVAFFGIGSYLYAFLASDHFGVHLPFLVALPIIVVVTAVSGVLIGAPTLRLRGDYLAIVTLGFGEITYLLLINLDRPVNITGGPSGIVGIDPPALAGLVATRNSEYYYMFLAAAVLAFLASARLRDSRIGWAWRAVREDELAARAMGVDTTVAKLQAFAVGASFAGIGGSLLASWQRSVFPDNFLFTESINILAMVILGGMGNLLGVVLGAALVVALPEVFREFQAYRLLVFGLLLMVLMVFRPQGLLAPRGRPRREAGGKGPAEAATGADAPAGRT